MASLIFDIIKGFKSAGLSEEQAVLQAQAIARLVDEQFATSKYLRQLQTHFETKLEEVKTEITKRILPTLTETLDIDLPLGGVSLDRFLNRLEKNLLLKALERAGGNKDDAARLLKISRDSLRYRMQKYEIDV
jgi:DNA-binding NtrC family response regulator